MQPLVYFHLKAAEAETVIEWKEEAMSKKKGQEAVPMKKL
jgi:hypothetical protein